MQPEEVFDFTLKHYEDCIKTSLDKGYTFYTFDEIEQATLSKKSLLMRHDIDYQLDIAIEIANIEKNFGVTSTYFIRFHSHTYSPLCIRDARKIQRIRSLGHQIGLHYELDFYSLVGSKDSIAGLKREIDTLSEIAGSSITCIAPHEPKRTGIKSLSKEQSDFLNIKLQAYDEKLLKDFKYISDSGARWREGSWHHHVSNETYDRLYVLTHPCWWYSSSPIENY